MAGSSPSDPPARAVEVNRRVAALGDRCTDPRPSSASFRVGGAWAIRPPLQRLRPPRRATPSSTAPAAPASWSSLVVVDALAFNDEPVARVLLPRRIPHGFHGTWLPAGVLGRVRVDHEGMIPDD
ncbi:carotenoid oxygenase family protein [Tautonia sociabilis]|uniref:carotenoid oxygenase family protein n=1 Tax=Tautonia sociabilis TaxID=2080755 RepID=UPI0018F65540